MRRVQEVELPDSDGQEAISTPDQPMALLGGLFDVKRPIAIVSCGLVLVGCGAASLLGIDATEARTLALADETGWTNGPWLPSLMLGICWGVNTAETSRKKDEG